MPSSQGFLILFVFIFIVLIYISSGTENPEIMVPVVLVGGAGLLIWLVGGGSKGLQEHLFMPAGTPTTKSNVVDPDTGDLNIDTDEYSLSKYGNIAESSDVDMMDQRMHGLDLSPTPDADPALANRIDNSDIVDMALNKGNAIFQPNGVGVSPTNSADLASFTLNEPGVMTKYALPQSNFIDLDEVLSRKQQHRANMNKKAADGHVRSTKNIYNKYFRNELDENEKRVWYSAEAQEFDTDFDPSL